MTKEKRSFFERLTGARQADNGGSMETPMEIYAEDDETRMTLHNNTDSESISSDWASATNNDAEGQLTIDVYQTDNEIVIKSTIAGVKPEDLEVSITNDMVTVKGDRKNEEVVEKDNYYYQECYWGSFSRSVVLPVDVLAEKADATLKNGILTIRLPKADITKTKKIQVRGF